MKFYHFLIASLGLSLGSCTLAEPEEVTGDPDSMQLAQVRCFGLKVIDIDRDAQGRITTINLTNEERFELDYVGTSTTPATIVITSWEEEYDDDDRATLIVDEETTWTNIVVKNGCIRSYDYSSTYRYDKPDNGTCHFVYNEKNQLVKETDTDGTVYDYVWKDDCLMRVVENGRDDTVFEYSEVENTTGQWDPMFAFKPMLNITGLFGRAPKMFAKRVRESGDDVQTAYSLLPNGLINHLKMGEVDDEESITTVYNFVYEKK